MRWTLTWDAPLFGTDSRKQSLGSLRLPVAFHSLRVHENRS